jgi:hypothetical protein
MSFNYILDLYQSDPEFVSIYHGNNGWTAEQCAIDSWENIKDLELHKTEYGYIAINRNDLLDKLAGFFIKPDCRNSKTFECFFNDLYKLMPRTFTATVHSSNAKAVKFLSSRGKVTLDNKITTYFVFKQESVPCLG